MPAPRRPPRGPPGRRSCRCCPRSPHPAYQVLAGLDDLAVTVHCDDHAGLRDHRDGESLRVPEPSTIRVHPITPRYKPYRAQVARMSAACATPSHASGPSVPPRPAHRPDPAGPAAACAPPPGPPRRPGSARRAPHGPCPGRPPDPARRACAPVHTSPVNRSVSVLSRSPRRLRTQSANIVCSWSCSPRSQSTSSGFSGRNGSSRDLDLPGGVEPPLHPEPLDQPVQPEALADHPDRADDRRGVRVDLVGRAGQPVAAGGGDVLAERQHRHLALRGQPPDPVGDQRGLGGRPARGVDLQRHGDQAVGRERPLEGLLDGGGVDH